MEPTLVRQQVCLEACSLLVSSSSSSSVSSSNSLPNNNRPPNPSIPMSCNRMFPPISSSRQGHNKHSRDTLLSTSSNKSNIKTSLVSLQARSPSSSHSQVVTRRPSRPRCSSPLPQLATRSSQLWAASACRVPATSHTSLATPTRRLRPWPRTPRPSMASTPA